MLERVLSIVQPRFILTYGGTPDRSLASRFGSQNEHVYPSGHEPLGLPQLRRSRALRLSGPPAHEPVRNVTITRRSSLGSGPFSRVDLCL